MLQKRKKVSTRHFKSIRGCCNSYSIEKKQEVVNYATKNGRNEATRHFNLDSSMVGRWIKASEKWLEKN